MVALKVIYRNRADMPDADPVTVSSVSLLPIALKFDFPSVVAIPRTNVFVALTWLFAIAAVAAATERVPSGETALLSILEIPLRRSSHLTSLRKFHSH